MPCKTLSSPTDWSAAAEQPVCPSALSSATSKPTITPAQGLWIGSSSIQPSSPLPELSNQSMGPRWGQSCGAASGDDALVGQGSNRLELFRTSLHRGEASHAVSELIHR